MFPFSFSIPSTLTSLLYSYSVSIFPSVFFFHVDLFCSVVVVPTHLFLFSSAVPLSLHCSSSLRNPVSSITSFEIPPAPVRPYCFHSLFSFSSFSRPVRPVFSSLPSSHFSASLLPFFSFSLPVIFPRLLSAFSVSRLWGG